MKISQSLANALVGIVKAGLDGGMAYVFSGQEPDNADDALDMTAEHTELAKLSINGDGATGLTWEAPQEGVIMKPAGDAWQGTPAFDGAEQGQATLQATFIRFCANGDDGRGAGNGTRLQICVSSGLGSCEAILSTTTITNNAPTPLRLDFARVVQVTS